MLTSPALTAVFAESEIISHLNQGETVADIIGGVCDSTARIIISQALCFGPVENYTITGEVARFSSITAVLKKRFPGLYEIYQALRDTIFETSLKGISTRFWPDRQKIWCRFSREAVDKNFNL